MRLALCSSAVSTMPFKWRGFDGQRLGREARPVGQRCAVRGRLLGDAAHFGGLIGIEVRGLDRRESDIDRLPDAHHQRVAVG